MAGIRLSYLCPIKNNLEYLVYMAESVLSQKNDEVEIVFVDGKSTDGTYECLLELQQQAPNQIQVHVEENDDKQPGRGERGIMQRRRPEAISLVGSVETTPVLLVRQILQFSFSI